MTSWYTSMMLARALQHGEFEAIIPLLSTCCWGRNKRCGCADHSQMTDNSLYLLLVKEGHDILKERLMANETLFKCFNKISGARITELFGAQAVNNLQFLSINVSPEKVAKLQRIHALPPNQIPEVDTYAVTLDKLRLAGEVAARMADENMRQLIAEEELIKQRKQARKEAQRLKAQRRAEKKAAKRLQQINAVEGEVAMEETGFNSKNEQPADDGSGDTLSPNPNMSRENAALLNKREFRKYKKQQSRQALQALRVHQSDHPEGQEKYRNQQSKAARIEKHKNAQNNPKPPNNVSPLTKQSAIPNNRGLNIESQCIYKSCNQRIEKKQTREHKQTILNTDGLRNELHSNSKSFDKTIEKKQSKENKKAIPNIEGAKNKSHFKFKSLNNTIEKKQSMEHKQTIPNIGLRTELHSDSKKLDKATEKKETSAHKQTCDKEQEAKKINIEQHDSNDWPTTKTRSKSKYSDCINSEENKVSDISILQKTPDPTKTYAAIVNKIGPNPTGSIIISQPRTGLLHENASAVAEKNESEKIIRHTDSCESEITNVNPIELSDGKQEFSFVYQETNNLNNLAKLNGIAVPRENSLDIKQTQHELKETLNILPSKEDVLVSIPFEFGKVLEQERGIYESNEKAEKLNDCLEDITNIEDQQLLADPAILDLRCRDPMIDENRDIDWNKPCVDKLGSLEPRKNNIQEEQSQTLPEIRRDENGQEAGPFFPSHHGPMVYPILGQFLDACATTDTNEVRELYRERIHTDNLHTVPQTNEVVNDNLQTVPQSNEVFNGSIAALDSIPLHEDRLPLNEPAIKTNQNAIHCSPKNGSEYNISVSPDKATVTYAQCVDQENPQLTNAVPPVQSLSPPPPSSPNVPKWPKCGQATTPHSPPVQPEKVVIRPQTGNREATKQWAEESGYQSPGVNFNNSDEERPGFSGGPPLFVKNWVPRSKRWHHLLTKVASSSHTDKVGSINLYLRDNSCVVSMGSCGTTVTVGIRDDGTEVAVKRIVKCYASLIRNELQNLRAPEIDHPHIIRYRDYVEDAHFAYLALELCECTLEERVRHLATRGTLVQYAPRLCYELLSGLAALHRANILHMDLKPRNVLIDGKGHVRLADFGLSHRLDDSQSTFYHATMNGTKCWRPPETLCVAPGAMNRYKQSSDVYVAGMILYYIVTGGRHPFGNEANTCELNIQRGVLPATLGLRDEVFVDLLYCMLNPDMSKRIATSDALKHPYFWSSVKRFEFLVAVGQDKDIHKPESALMLTHINNAMCGGDGSDINWGIAFDQDLLGAAGMTADKHYSVADVLTDILPALDDADPQQLTAVLKGRSVAGHVLEALPRLFMVVYEGVGRTAGWISKRSMRHFFHTAHAS